MYSSWAGETDEELGEEVRGLGCGLELQFGLCGGRKGVPTHVEGLLAHYARGGIKK